MPPTPRISEAEWQVMKVLWANSPLTADAVVEALAGTTQWTPKTVKTLLNRLVGKGALGYTKDGRRYLYEPLVDQESCLRAENRSFLQRVYGGALKPMLVSFLEEEDLSPEDIAELKRILTKKGRQ